MLTIDGVYRILGYLMFLSALKRAKVVQLSLNLTQDDSQ